MIILFLFKKIDMEEFRDIKGYEGLYQISNLGRVKSLKFNKEKVLIATSKNNRYLKVGLFKNSEKKTKTVHQLVVIAFLNHIPCGPKLVVNHINFNTHDNRVENLEIVTSRENGNKKHLPSTSQYTGVQWRNDCKKWRARIHVNGKDKSLGCFTNELEASEAYQKELRKIEKEVSNGI
jgi:hypothetical protein